MSLVVVILFAVCWLPYHLYFLIIYLFPGTYIILFDFCGILVEFFKNLIKNTDNIFSISSISIRWSDLIKLYNFSASLIYELKSYFNNNLFFSYGWEQLVGGYLPWGVLDGHVDCPHQPHRLLPHEQVERTWTGMFSTLINPAVCFNTFYNILSSAHVHRQGKWEGKM